MRLLILGGTEFVGRAVAEEALARGWQTTVFHRGHHAPPAGASALLGDRTAPDGLSALAYGEWDLVVDTWSATPSGVRDAARLLAGRVGHYSYISSRSVYAPPVRAGGDESDPLVAGSPDAGAVEYAQAKRGGELAATDAFGDHALLVRAGVILGPWENIGRLPWWLRRIARGGPVLAPGPRDLPVQFIDVRDLATWTLDAASRGLGGPYNLICPPDHTTMGELLQACLETTRSDARLHWTAPQDILDAGIAPFTELPIWLPPGETHDAFYRGDVSKALAAGLRCRPAAETVADTWSWLRTLPGPPPQRPEIGLSPTAEAKLLTP